LTYAINKGILLKKRWKMNINNIDDLKQIIETEEMVIGYFSSQTCNVCKDLYPKIEKMAEENFPKAKLVRIDSEDVPTYVGVYSIFVIPAVIVFAKGKETLRRVRNLSVIELEDAIYRYYDMVFDSNEN
jgi:thioredoxin-like negative regulator of GroEL